MQTEKTLQDFLVESSYLQDEVLYNELITREITPHRGPIINQRRQLANAWLRENAGHIFIPYFQFEPVVDLRKCAALVTVFELQLNQTPLHKLKAMTNLKVLDARVGRILCTTPEEQNLARNFAQNIKRLILNDVHDLNNSQCSAQGEQTNDSASNRAACSHQVNAPSSSTQSQPAQNDNLNGNVNSNRQESAGTTQYRNFDPFELDHLMASMRLNQDHLNSSFLSNHSGNSNKLPVHKWKIKFSGSRDKKDAFEFLRIVNSKANSYQTTKDELFASASEFFVEEASRWYFASKLF